MTTTSLDPARLLAASLDANPEISAESITQKFLVRWKLFTACTLIVPLIALWIASLIPSTYKSTAQMLIRVEGGTDALYNGISPPLVALTGATTAEIIRSTPIASQMIETVGVENADIARPAYKVLFGKAAALILPLLGREPEDHQLAANPKLKYIFLADELKPSIDATTLLMDHSTGNLRDEMVNINTVKANSREKVAAMVNGLCEVFIREYNLRSKNEIETAYKTLDDQATAAQADLDRLRSTPAGANVALPAERAADTNNNPLSSGLAHTVADLEAQLVVLRQTYTESAAEVVQAEAELKRDRALLAREEAIDATSELLGNIKTRQRQLLLAATLYQTSQSNLSIVERGLTPKKTKLTPILKYGIPGAGGLVGGMFIGAIAILMLNLLDPRLFVASDITPVSGLPLLGVIPNSGVGLNFAQLNDLPLTGARPALLKALGKLDLLDRDPSRVIVVTQCRKRVVDSHRRPSAGFTFGPQTGKQNVLLADANFDHPAPHRSRRGKNRTRPAGSARRSKPRGRRRAPDQTSPPRVYWDGKPRFARRSKFEPGRLDPASRIWPQKLRHRRYSRCRPAQFARGHRAGE